MHFLFLSNSCLSQPVDYLLARLFDLNQDGEDEQQQHHPRGHADHRAVRLCDLVENAFALFLWPRMTKGDELRATAREKEREKERGSTLVTPRPPLPSGQSGTLAFFFLFPGATRLSHFKINSHSKNIVAANKQLRVVCAW